MCYALFIMYLFACLIDQAQHTRFVKRLLLSSSFYTVNIILLQILHIITFKFNSIELNLIYKRYKSILPSF